LAHAGSPRHVDSDTSFNIKRSKVNLQGVGTIAADSRRPTSLMSLTH